MVPTLRFLFPWLSLSVVQSFYFPNWWWQETSTGSLPLPPACIQFRTGYTVDCYCSLPTYWLEWPLHRSSAVHSSEYDGRNNWNSWPVFSPPPQSCLIQQHSLRLTLPERRGCLMAANVFVWPVPHWSLVPHAECLIICMEFTGNILYKIMCKTCILLP